MKFQQLNDIINDGFILNGWISLLLIGHENFVTVEIISPHFYRFPAWIFCFWEMFIVIEGDTKLWSLALKTFAQDNFLL